MGLGKYKDVMFLNAGGEVDISTEPGKGTTVLAWVPFPEPEEQDVDQLVM